MEAFSKRPNIKKLGETVHEGEQEKNDMLLHLLRREDVGSFIINVTKRSRTLIVKQEEVYG